MAVLFLCVEHANTSNDMVHEEALILGVRQQVKVGTGTEIAAGTEPCHLNHVRLCFCGGSETKNTENGKHSLLRA